jgi:hypothetical protein
MKLEKTIKILDLLVPFGRLLRSNDNKIPFKNWLQVMRILGQTFFVYWLFSFIPFVGSFIYTLLLLPLSAFAHIRVKNIKSKQDKANIFLLYFVVILIGFGGIWNFIGHTFLADTVATQIGWKTGSPFQTELAFYTLGSGIAGLMTIWFRGHMITALVVSKSIFLYGAAFVHIQDAIINNNYSPLNIGTPLVGDIIFPTLLLYMLIVSLKGQMKTHSE